MPDAAPQPDHIHFHDVLAVEKDFASETGVPDGVVHAIQRAEESGFSATGRTNDRSNFVDRDVQAQVKDRLLWAIEEIEIGDLKAHWHLLARNRRSRTRHPHFGRELCGDVFLAL